MRVNIKYKPPLLKFLSQNTNNDTFVPFGLDYYDFMPEYVFSKFNNVHKSDVLCADDIGGKMYIPVAEHIDQIDCDASLVYFPKVSKPLLFSYYTTEGVLRQDVVGSGDAFIFDHEEPHSVYAVGENKDDVGVWYYVACGVDFVKDGC